MFSALNTAFTVYTSSLAALLKVGEMREEIRRLGFPQAKVHMPYFFMPEKCKYDTTK